MYCTKCGKGNPDDALFCGECGTKFKETSEKGVEKTTVSGKASIEEKPGVPSERKTFEEHYAGFAIRLGAYLADLGFTTIFFIIVSIFLSFLFGDYVFDLVESIDQTILGYMIFLVYSALSLAVFSTTPGKFVYGLKVLDKDLRKRISLNVAIMRPFLQMLSTFLWGIGYWRMNKDPYQQAWHDKRLNTVVVGKPKHPIVGIIITLISILFVIYVNIY